MDQESKFEPSVAILRIFHYYNRREGEEEAFSFIFHPNIQKARPTQPMVTEILDIQSIIKVVFNKKKPSFILNMMKLSVVGQF